MKYVQAFKDLKISIWFYFPFIVFEKEMEISVDWRKANVTTFFRKGQKVNTRSSTVSQPHFSSWEKHGESPLEAHFWAHEV